MRKTYALSLSLLLCALFVGAALLLRLPSGGPVSVRAESRGAAALPEGGVETRAALELLPGELLDLNAASAEELEKLPGIGRSLAEAIVRWREEHGPFERAEDVLLVKGIGEARYAAIADSITVEEQP